MNPALQEAPAVPLTVHDGRATIALNEPDRGNAVRRLRTKAITCAAMANTLADQPEAERTAFLATSESPDFREGVRSFLQKRAAHFTMQGSS